MWRRWFLAVVLLALLATGVALAISTSTSTPAPTAPAPAPANAVQITAPVGHTGVGSRITLGMGLGIGDVGLLTTDNVASLRAMDIGVLRFGGSGSISGDDYDWQSGCSYGNDTLPICNGKPGAGGNLLDGFLNLTSQVGATPLIIVNGEIDDPQQAAQLVAYYQHHCVRIAPSGHCMQPYWEIGNAPANWQHFAVPLTQRRTSDAAGIQPDQYAALVIAYVSAMQRVDAQIKSRIVVNEWITGATDQSWVEYVGSVDTYYAPLLYSPAEVQPGTDQIISAVQNGSPGRLGIDAWLQDLRDSLAQFSDSRGVGIIVGQWSIDADQSFSEPSVYSGYSQALFVGEMLAHFWQDANSNGQNPLQMAMQYPLVGSGQEPFDIAGGRARPATNVYALVADHFGDYPLTVALGETARKAGITAAAAEDRNGQVSILLLNTNVSASYTLTLLGLPARPATIWWIQPDSSQISGVSAVQHALVKGNSVTVPPWAIAVVQD